jgi:hypothetical protein
VKFKVKKGWEGFALPKKQRVRPAPKAKESEATLQAKTNALLDYAGIEYLRMSSDLYRCIFANPTIPIHIKRFIKEQIAGWPDNMIFLPISDKYNLSLNIELKTSIGKQNHRQADLARRIAIQVLRSEDEVRAAIIAAQAVQAEIKKQWGVE